MAPEEEDEELSEADEAAEREWLARYEEDPTDHDRAYDLSLDK